MSDTLQVVGACQAITEKPSGWTEFEIAVPGKNYPVRLATKKPELVEAGRATKGAVSTWTYNEVESDKINEHTGKPYMNRYLEGVMPAAEIPAGGKPEPHHEAMHFADKDRAITRMACLKAAAQVYESLGSMDGEGNWDAPLAVLKAADRFERWVMRDIDDVPFRVEPESSPLSEHDQTIEF